MRFDNPEPGKYQLIVRSLDSGEEKAADRRTDEPGALQSRLVARWQDHPVRGESAGGRAYGLMAVDASKRSAAAC